MRSIGKFLALSYACFALAGSAYSQSSREQLQQMVEQMQKAPGDGALRERIVKLASTLKPAPALPDAAIRFEGRAQFAFRNAKTETDFLAAAREYEQAVAAAPWVPGYYSDLCTIYEKAGKFEEAKRNCGFYLVGLADPAQVIDAKRRIAGLEFGIEKANSPAARAASQKARAEELVRSLDGGVWQCFESAAWKNTLEVRGNRLFYVRLYKKDSTHQLNGAHQVSTLSGTEFKVKQSSICNASIADRSERNLCDGTGRISESGDAITFPTLTAPKISGDGTMGGTRYGTLRDDAEVCRRVK